MIFLDLKVERYLENPIFSHHRAIEEVHLENIKNTVIEVTLEPIIKEADK